MYSLIQQIFIEDLIRAGNSNRFWECSSGPNRYSFCPYGGKETGRKYTKIQIIKGTYVWVGLRVILIFLLIPLYIFCNYIMLS